MLEPVWNGQRGVYIGSGLRGMESYSTHAPDVDAFARSLFTPTDDVVEDYIRVYGPISRDALFAIMGGEAVQIMSCVGRLVKAKRVRVTEVVGRRGRSAQQFEVV